jgi:hypothetical protein
MSELNCTISKIIYAIYFEDLWWNEPLKQAKQIMPPGQKYSLVLNTGSMLQLMSSIREDFPI